MTYYSARCEHCNFGLDTDSLTDLNDFYSGECEYCSEEMCYNCDNGGLHKDCLEDRDSEDRDNELMKELPEEEDTQ